MGMMGIVGAEFLEFEGEDVVAAVRGHPGGGEGVVDAVVEGQGFGDGGAAVAEG